MLITNPISANQIADVAIDLKCVGPISCPTLPNVLQAMVDKICEVQDFSSLDFGACVGSGTTLLEILQAIIDAQQCGICDDNGSGSSDVITGLLECSSDNWSCAEANSCFTLTNPCAPGTITVKNVLQALLNRNVAYGNLLKIHCDQINTLQNQVATLELTVRGIQSSCCP